MQGYQYLSPSLCPLWSYSSWGQKVVFIPTPSSIKAKVVKCVMLAGRFINIYLLEMEGVAYVCVKDQLVS